MQLMAAMQYFDRLESEMSRDQFGDVTRPNQREWCSPLGPGVLDDAFQVGQYLILLHIITHYLHVSIMNFGSNLG
jgi:hypothetical protein